VTASSVDNRGKLLATGNLGLSLNGTLNNQSNASIQSAGSLTVSGVSQLDNGSGALLAGNRLDVNASTLNNSGTIQGAVPAIAASYQRQPEQQRKRADQYGQPVLWRRYGHGRHHQQQRQLAILWRPQRGDGQWRAEQ
jgi:adhesin HecA-like repeat protein